MDPLDDFKPGVEVTSVVDGDVGKAVVLPRLGSLDDAPRDGLLLHRLRPLRRARIGVRALCEDPAIDDPQSLTCPSSDPSCRGWAAALSSRTERGGEVGGRLGPLVALLAGEICI